jgi:hypothetical protein
MRVLLNGVHGETEIDDVQIKETIHVFADHEITGCPVGIAVNEGHTVLLLIPFKVIETQLKLFTASQIDDGGCMFPG